jgi:hypothetical protein
MPTSWTDLRTRLDWLTHEPLRREWLFERRDGNCRLTGSFAVRLSETARTWGQAVAPLAEWVARELWSTVKKPTRLQEPSQRLRVRYGPQQQLPSRVALRAARTLPCVLSRGRLPLKTESPHSLPPSPSEMDTAAVFHAVADLL